MAIKGDSSSGRLFPATGSLSQPPTLSCNASYLAATMLARGLRQDYCSLRQIRRASAMTAAEVDNAMMQLARAGMVETQRYPRYMYRVIPSLPGVGLTP